MAEAKVRECFISQLNDVTIQRLLEEKVTDNPDLSVLTASDDTLRWVKMNVDTATMNAAEMEAVPVNFQEISRISMADVRETVNKCAISNNSVQNSLYVSKNVGASPLNASVQAPSIVTQYNHELELLRKELAVLQDSVLRFIAQQR